MYVIEHWMSRENHDDIDIFFPIFLTDLIFREKKITKMQTINFRCWRKSSRASHNWPISQQIKSYLGSTSTISNRCIQFTFAFDFISRQRFHSETYEGETFLAWNAPKHHFYSLCFSSSFIHFILKITHVYKNEMQRKPEDHRDHEQLRGCFYRGRVRTDDRSAVAVSLCDGMVSDKIQWFFNINHSIAMMICVQQF